MRRTVLLGVRCRSQAALARGDNGCAAAARFITRAGGRPCARVELHRRDCALVNRLDTGRCLEHHDELIERFDAPDKPDAIYEIDLNGLPLFAHGIEEIALRMRIFGFGRH